MQKSIIIKCTASKQTIQQAKMTITYDKFLHRFIFIAVAASWLCSLSFITLTMENLLIMGPQLDGYPWPFKGSTCQAMQKSCQILQDYMNCTESNDNPYRIISNRLSTIQLYFYFLCLYSKNEMFQGPDFNNKIEFSRRSINK